MDGYAPSKNPSGLNGFDTPKPGERELMSLEVSQMTPNGNCSTIRSRRLPPDPSRCHVRWTGGPVVVGINLGCLQHPGDKNDDV